MNKSKVLLVLTTIFIIITIVCIGFWGKNKITDYNIPYYTYGDYNNGTITKQEYEDNQRLHSICRENIDKYECGTFIAVYLTIFSGTIGIFLKTKENKGIDMAYRNLLKIGISIIIIGIIGVVFAILEQSDILTILTIPIPFLGLWIIFGYITHRIIPNVKYSFAIGLFLGIIGIIIAICLQNKGDTTNSTNRNINSNNNKYEDLERLQKLKEQGIITDAEFISEKGKLLK